MRKAISLLMMLCAIGLASAASWAKRPDPPLALGPDCGVGASIVTGTDSSGRILLGTGATTCTLSFTTTFANPPACFVDVEDTADGISFADGATAFTDHVQFFPDTPWQAGDFVVYHCDAQ